VSRSTSEARASPARAWSKISVAVRSRGQRCTRRAPAAEPLPADAFAADLRFKWARIAVAYGLFRDARDGASIRFSPARQVLPW